MRNRSIQLVVMLLVFNFYAGAAAFGFSMSTLQNLPGVGVSVKQLSPDAERLGVSGDALELLMESRLKSGAITVFPNDRVSDIPGAPLLELTVLVRKVEGESSYLFTARLALQEMVVMERPTQHLASIYAATWEKTILGITHQKGYVDGAVGQLIARFIREFKEENVE